MFSVFVYSFLSKNYVLISKNMSLAFYLIYSSFPAKENKNMVILYFIVHNMIINYWWFYYYIGYYVYYHHVPVIYIVTNTGTRFVGALR